MVLFYFCFQWWWLVAASRGCGFSEKGRDREKKKGRIKKQYLNEVLKKLEYLMYDVL